MVIARPAEILDGGRKARLQDLKRHGALPGASRWSPWDFRETRRAKTRPADRRLEAAGVHAFDRLVVFIAVDRLELHDVARPEEDHEVARYDTSCLGS